MFWKSSWFSSSGLPAKLFGNGYYELRTWRLGVGFPANTYLFKVSNRITGKRFEICSKVTLKTPGRGLLTSFWCFIR